jgi:hypothetical protein
MTPPNLRSQSAKTTSAGPAGSVRYGPLVPPSELLSVRSTTDLERYLDAKSNRPLVYTNDQYDFYEVQPSEGSLCGPDDTPDPPELFRAKEGRITKNSTGFYRGMREFRPSEGSARAANGMAALAEALKCAANITVELVHDRNVARTLDSLGGDIESMMPESADGGVLIFLTFPRGNKAAVSGGVMAGGDYYKQAWDSLMQRAKDGFLEAPDTQKRLIWAQRGVRAKPAPHTRP